MKCIFALILVLIIFKHTKYTIQKIVLICVLGMVRGDRTLFVRKGGASQKKIGKHCTTQITQWHIQQNITTPLLLNLKRQKIQHFGISTTICSSSTVIPIRRGIPPPSPGRNFISSGEEFPLYN